MSIDIAFALGYCVLKSAQLPVGSDAQASLARIVEAASAAARAVTDPDAPVHCSFGDVRAADYLWQLNIARCFLAHEIAMALGSRA